VKYSEFVLDRLDDEEVHELSRVELLLARSIRASEGCWDRGWGLISGLLTRNFGIANPASKSGNTQRSKRGSPAGRQELASFHSAAIYASTLLAREAKNRRAFRSTIERSRQLPKVTYS